MAKPNKVEDKGLIEDAKVWLENVTKSMPYSSSAAKERLKKMDKQLEEESPNEIPDKESSMKINNRGNGTRPWEA